MVIDQREHRANVEVNKKIVESALEKGPELVMVGIKEVAPKLGFAAAAAKVAVETVKHTGGLSSLPPLQLPMPVFHTTSLAFESRANGGSIRQMRLLTIGSAALVTAAGTSLGMELGKVAEENTKKGDEIEASKSKLAEISKDEPESPPLHLPMPDSHRPAFKMPMPVFNRPEGVSGKWREQRENDKF